MRLFTDDPALAAAFVPAEAGSHEWQREEGLPSDDAQLISALGGAPVWNRYVEPHPPFWSTLVVVSTSEGSQFDMLDRMLRDGRRFDRPVASLALAGNRFRGQHDRTWEAVRGNLHLSVVAPIHVDAERIGAGLSMLPAVAAVDAIMNASGEAIRPGIKWVNDILIHERKVGGVLTAAHTTGRQIEHVVWGIGINLEVAPAVAPTPFVPATTCLHGVPGGELVTLPRLFRALLDAIAVRHAELLREGSSALLSAYRQYSLVIGRAVRVWDPSGGPPLAEGIVAGIEPDLSLRLEGQHRPVSKGRLELMPIVPEAQAIDPATVGAISAAISSRYPGARVTRIEAEP